MTWLFDLYNPRLLLTVHLCGECSPLFCKLCLRLVSVGNCCRCVRRTAGNLESADFYDRLSRSPYHIQFIILLCVILSDLKCTGAVKIYMRFLWNVVLVQS